MGIFEPLEFHNKMLGNNPARFQFSEMLMEIYQTKSDRNIWKSVLTDMIAMLF